MIYRSKASIRIGLSSGRTNVSPCSYMKILSEENLHKGYTTADRTHKNLVEGFENT